MMKKVLVLMLVLGLVTAANAAMELTISVNGIVDPPESLIVLHPSEYAVLDIHSSGYTAGEDDTYFALVANTSLATISGGVVVIPPAPADSSIGDDAVGYGMPIPEGENGVQGLIVLLTTGTGSAPAGIYFDEIVFHCEAQGDVAVKLYTIDQYFEQATLVDSVIIHQVPIPEPMTMALLGLGGLFLRRRKKQQTA